MPVCQRKIRSSLCRLRNEDTQVSLTPFLAIVLAKFLIISRVGGVRRAVSPWIYSTSSFSCCGWSLLCKTPRGWHLPWCLLASVDRSTPNFFATSRYVKCSPGASDSIASIAAWIGSILVELCGVEVWWVWKWGVHWSELGIERTDTVHELMMTGLRVLQDYTNVIATLDLDA